jgi:hypothetical protein
MLFNDIFVILLLKNCENLLIYFLFAWDFVANILWLKGKSPL